MVDHCPFCDHPVANASYPKARPYLAQTPDDRELCLLLSHNCAKCNTVFASEFSILFSKSFIPEWTSKESMKEGK